MQTTPNDSTDAPDRPRTVQLPWGRARVLDEVRTDGTADGERTIEVGIARLESSQPGEGWAEPLLRFFYRADGRVVRGPLTLRPAEIDALAGAVRSLPELRALLRRLAGD